jgi:hypothetical protein
MREIRAYCQNASNVGFAQSKNLLHITRYCDGVWDLDVGMEHLEEFDKLRVRDNREWPVAPSTPRSKKISEARC